MTRSLGCLSRSGILSAVAALVHDAHDGQFGGNCAVCHTPDGWEGATFDHNLTDFLLVGRHAKTECEACHINNVFKGTPDECVACHAEPQFHAGSVGTACANCHTALAWTPAQFDRPHSFPFNHGESGVSPCQRCHPDSLAAYTCYGCHEHNPAKIERKHLEEGIRDFQDCARCHPTGREEEKEEYGD